MRVKQPRLYWTASFLLAATSASAQVIPSPQIVLYDAKHKEPKSGVELTGNQLVIRSGVGTPTNINVLAFSGDGRFLAAGKDFGRVVAWNLGTKSFLCSIDTKQGIVRAVALSSDGHLVATSGSDSDADIKIWELPDGKPLATFKVGHPLVQRLLFAADSSALIVAENDGVSYVLDINSGQHLQDLQGEWAPVLSNDAKTLMTVSKTAMVLRNTKDWRQEATLPKLSKYAVPLSLDSSLDTYIFADATDENSFVSARLSTGQLNPNPRVARLPRANFAAGVFATIDPSSGVVFGHSDGRLWAWDWRTGRSCASSVLYSESGALSPDGSLVVAALDNSIMTPDKIKPGVGLWETAKVREVCELN